jgi:hypothetical protein
MPIPPAQQVSYRYASSYEIGGCEVSLAVKLQREHPGWTERNVCHGSQQVTAGAGQNASRLLARRAGIHVDFHADRHFNDLRSFPSHSGLPRDGAEFCTDTNVKPRRV